MGDPRDMLIKSSPISEPIFLRSQDRISPSSKTQVRIVVLKGWNLVNGS